MKHDQRHAKSRTRRSRPRWVLLVSLAVLAGCDDEGTLSGPPLDAEAIDAGKRPPGGGGGSGLTISVTEIGTVPGHCGWLQVRGISDSGEVVGWGGCSGILGFYWQSGTMTLLDTGMFPEDVSDVGRIAGVHFDGVRDHAAVFERVNGIWTPLFLPEEGTWSQARGISDNGAKVVGVEVVGAEVVPVFWARAGGNWVRTRLPGGGAARDVNDDGIVVGELDGGEPVAWPNPGTMIALQILPGHSYGDAVAINRQGDIVGTSGNRGVVWRRMGAGWGPPQLVASELSGKSRWSSNWATDISDTGRITLTGRRQGELLPAAYLWDPTTAQLFALKGPTQQKGSDVTAINERGQVAGTAPLEVAVLWTATP